MNFVSTLLVTFTTLVAVSPVLATADMDEPRVNVSGKYVIPNEFENYEHFSRLEPNSSPSNKALIAVGSLRAFNAAAVLRRDFLIALDYSDNLKKFNTALAQLIRHRLRSEFLAAITGTMQPIFTRQDMLNAIDRALQLPFSESADVLSESLFKLLPPSPGGPLNRLGWLLALRQYAKNEANWNATFFASDVAYFHLRKLILDQKVLIVRGSLSGEFSMRKLAEFLRLRSLVVSEVDISNAVEHIVDHESVLGLNRLIANLKRLPQNEQSRVLVTIDQRLLPDIEPASRKPTWSYQIKTVEELSEIAELGTAGQLARALTQVRCHGLFQF